MKTEQIGTRAFERSRGSRWGRSMLVGALAFLATVAMGMSEARAQGAGEAGGRPRQGQRLRARDRVPALAAKRLAAHLHLTPDQRQQIQSLRQEMQRDLADEQAQLRRLGEQLRAAWQEPQPQGGRILELRRQMSVQRDSIQDRRVQFRLAVFRLLTPEQRIEAQRMLVERARHGRLQPVIE
jgi:Spy/CpxP family protein refolding chaperone